MQPSSLSTPSANEKKTELFLPTAEDIQKMISEYSSGEVGIQQTVDLAAKGAFLLIPIKCQGSVSLQDRYWDYLQNKVSADKLSSQAAEVRRKLKKHLSKGNGTDTIDELTNFLKDLLVVAGVAARCLGTEPNSSFAKNEIDAVYRLYDSVVAYFSKTSDGSPLQPSKTVQPAGVESFQKSTGKGPEKSDTASRGRHQGKPPVSSNTEWQQATSEKGADSATVLSLGDVESPQIGSLRLSVDRAARLMYCLIPRKCSYVSSKGMSAKLQHLYWRWIQGSLSEWRFNQLLNTFRNNMKDYVDALPCYYTSPEHLKDFNKMALEEANNFLDLLFEVGKVATRCLPDNVSRDLIKTEMNEGMLGCISQAESLQQGYKLLVPPDVPEEEVGQLEVNEPSSPFSPEPGRRKSHRSADLTAQTGSE